MDAVLKKVTKLKKQHQKQLTKQNNNSKTT
jgi:hypothetical protein